MSTQYTDEELREIENPDEISDSQYTRWVQLKFQRPKRKRRIFVEVWNSSKHSNSYQWC